MRIGGKTVVIDTLPNYRDKHKEIKGQYALILSSEVPIEVFFKKIDGAMHSCTHPCRVYLVVCIIY